jgi:hypothetical protein
LRKHGRFKLGVKMLLLQLCTLMEEEEVKLKSVHDVKSLAWMTREKLQVNKVH